MPYSADDVVLAHRTLIAFNKGMTRWASRGALYDEDGVVCCAGGTPIPMIANTVLRLDRDVAAPEAVARADAFFGDLGRGFTVAVPDSGQDEDLRRACLEAGLELFGSPTPDMVCTAPLPERAGPEGIAVEVVDDERGVRGFLEVNAAAYATYGMPPEVFGHLFDQPDVLLRDPSAHVLLASRAGEAVATALVYESDGAASVQWVGTVPGARTSGLGALVTIGVTNLAFARGASSVSLQASPMGAPVYTALGYETTHTHVEYLRMPARR